MFTMSRLCVYVVLLLSKSIYGEIAGNKNSHIVKRDLVHSFSSNPIFHRVFDEANRGLSLSARFFPDSVPYAYQSGYEPINEESDEYNSNDVSQENDSKSDEIESIGIFITNDTPTPNYISQVEDSNPSINQNTTYIPNISYVNSTTSITDINLNMTTVSTVVDVSTTTDVPFMSNTTIEQQYTESLVDNNSITQENAKNALVSLFYPFAWPTIPQQENIETSTVTPFITNSQPNIQQLFPNPDSIPLVHDIFASIPTETPSVNDPYDSFTSTLLTSTSRTDNYKEPVSNIASPILQGQGQPSTTQILGSTLNSTSIPKHLTNHKNNIYFTSSLVRINDTKPEVTSLLLQDANNKKKQLVIIVENGIFNMTGVDRDNTNISSAAQLYLSKTNSQKNQTLRPENIGFNSTSTDTNYIKTLPVGSEINSELQPHQTTTFESQSEKIIVDKTSEPTFTSFTETKSQSIETTTDPIKSESLNIISNTQKNGIKTTPKQTNNKRKNKSTNFLSDIIRNVIGYNSLPMDYGTRHLTSKHKKDFKDKDFRKQLQKLWNKDFQRNFAAVKYFPKNPNSYIQLPRIYNDLPIDLVRQLEKSRIVYNQKNINLEDGISENVNGNRNKKDTS